MIKSKIPVLFAGLLLVAIPLAGCVGGGGDSGPSTGPQANDSNNTSNLEGVSAADLRPHVHNRWENPVSSQSIDQVVLFDETLTVNATGTQYNQPPMFNSCENQAGDPQSLTAQCYGDRQFVPQRWANGEQKIVPPGTSHVEVTLEFNAQDFEQMALYYKHRDSGAQWVHHTNSSNGGLYQPGGDNRSIPVTVQMSDDGHAHASAWAFSIEARGNPAGDASPTGDTHYGEGQVTVKVVAYRQAGDLPLEPPHPLFYQNQDPPTHVYKIGELSGETTGFTQVGRMVTEIDQDNPGASKAPTLAGDGLRWEIPVGFTGSRPPAYADPDPAQKISGEFTAQIIPPTTQLIYAEVVVNGEEATSTGTQICLMANDIPGEGWGNARPIGECKDLASGETLTFQTQIKNRQTDSFYTPSDTEISFSRWTFWIQIRPSSQESGAIVQFEGDVSANLFISDQSEFTMPSWAVSPGGS